MPSSSMIGQHEGYQENNGQGGIHSGNDNKYNIIQRNLNKFNEERDNQSMNLN